MGFCVEGGFRERKGVADLTVANTMLLPSLLQNTRRAFSQGRDFRIPVLSFFGSDKDLHNRIEIRPQDSCEDESKRKSNPSNSAGIRSISLLETELNLKIPSGAFHHPHVKNDPFNSQSQSRRGFWGQALQSADWRGSSRQVTNLLISANVLIFLLEMHDPSIMSNFSQVNILLDRRGEFYRILTAAFLHGGPLHLLSNMLSLHWIAPSVEGVLGRPCFLLVYFASVLSAGLMHYIAGPTYGALVGASGGVLGLLAATLVYKIRNRRIFPMTPNDFSWIGQLIAINLFIVAIMGSSISHWGHLGGFLGGGLAMLLFGPRYRWGNQGITNAPLIPFFKLPR